MDDRLIRLLTRQNELLEGIWERLDQLVNDGRERANYPTQVEVVERKSGWW